MRHVWLRILTAAIFLMVQVVGAAPAGPPCGAEQRETVRCTLPCCSGGFCECGMAPSKAPAKPAPLTPVPQAQALKFIPALLNGFTQTLAPLVLQKPIRLLAPDAFLPHCPPALALHCALLI